MNKKILIKNRKKQMIESALFSKAVPTESRTLLYIDFGGFKKIAGFINVTEESKIESGMI